MVIFLINKTGFDSNDFISAVLILKLQFLEKLIYKDTYYVLGNYYYYCGTLDSFLDRGFYFSSSNNNSFRVNNPEDMKK
jgi:hypothetical protein